ncbi:ParB/RepB/Spo0J family partition protein [Streptomyces sp. LHD-70]|uniref:ParB/RepB/Spo0J family partition protein n=1 Tax=Streptomyces sp. LHD-70 TaxID=3072140 RepID=UPI00280D6264|nr:ParB/RepB/Spo0J family partition protein [Streptomyces sp. LHD-70]MDQ8706211.1 ParB/RepB/Spo0J family partition protein [Streptomyces sp. LHD-70]
MTIIKCAPDLESLLRPIESVQRYPGNPKRHDLDVIKDSITRYGMWRAIVVQKSTGYVLAGNGQHEAATDLGADQIPMVEVDVDDEDAKRIVLMDNKSGENGYDNQALAELLKHLQDTPDGLTGSGYDNQDLDDLLDALTDEALNEGELGLGGDADQDDLSAVWGVIITAGSESEQVELLERFVSEGLNVRAVMT